jgi:hypothetical protein
MLTRLTKVAALILISARLVFATGTWEFKAGDYYLGMPVSLESNSVAGPVRFAPPQAKEPSIIQVSQFKSFKYDAKAQRFFAEFVNLGDPTLPTSFKVSVRGSKGLLTTGGKRISFLADWVVQ